MIKEKGRIVMIFSSNFKFKIRDIRYTLGRIIVSGSNNYYDPWKIDHLPDEVRPLINDEPFRKYCDVIDV